MELTDLITTRETWTGDLLFFIKGVDGKMKFSGGTCIHNAGVLVSGSRHFDVDGHEDHWPCAKLSGTIPALTAAALTQHLVDVISGDQWLLYDLGLAAAPQVEGLDFD